MRAEVLRSLTFPNIPCPPRTIQTISVGSHGCLAIILGWTTTRFQVPIHLSSHPCHQLAAASTTRACPVIVNVGHAYIAIAVVTGSQSILCPLCCPFLPAGCGMPMARPRRRLEQWLVLDFSLQCIVGAVSAFESSGNLDPMSYQAVLPYQAAGHSSQTVGPVGICWLRPFPNSRVIRKAGLLPYCPAQCGRHSPKGQARRRMRRGTSFFIQVCRQCTWE